MFENISRCCKPNSLITSSTGVLLGLLLGYNAWNKRSITAIETGVGRYLGDFAKKTTDTIELASALDIKASKIIELGSSLKNILQYSLYLDSFLSIGNYSIVRVANVITGVINLIFLPSYLVRLYNFFFKSPVIRARDIEDIIDSEIDTVRKSDIPDEKKEKVIKNMRNIRDTVIDLDKEDKDDKEPEREVFVFEGDSSRIFSNIKEPNLNIRVKKALSQETLEFVQRAREFNSELIKERARQLILKQMEKEAVVITSPEEKQIIRNQFLTEEDQRQFTIRRNIIVNYYMLHNRDLSQEQREFGTALINRLDNLGTAQIIRFRDSLIVDSNRAIEAIYSSVIEQTRNFNEIVITDFPENDLNQLVRVGDILIQLPETQQNSELLRIHIINFYNTLLRIPGEKSREIRDLLIKIRSIAQKIEAFNTYKTLVTVIKQINDMATKIDNLEFEIEEEDF